MWSGPRNISTALMRAWGSRTDTHVVDEPFYASYLARTGLVHPGRPAILAAQPTDWRTVVRNLTADPLPGAARISYQKHMAQHVPPDLEPSALDGLRHAFLIREPAEVAVSYAKVRGEPTLEDLGLPQQLELFQRYGGPVVDARDVLQRPEPVLRALCAALDVPFDPAMLSWATGPRSTDGVWAEHWYAGVWRSTGFAPYRPASRAVPPRLRALVERCRPFYDALAARRLEP